jgi:gluconate 2-dehydrogenase gamma chain
MKIESDPVSEATGLAPKRFPSYHRLGSLQGVHVPQPPSGTNGSRRQFVGSLTAGISAAWLASLWPAAIADAADAMVAARAGQSVRYRILTPQQAADFGAVADRIIPADDTPGATDVGVVFFADRMLSGMTADQKPAFEKALADVNAAVRTRVPGRASFASLNAREQDDVLTSIQDTESFGVLRTITLAGYFSHPGHGGNKGNAGWKAIGFEDRMAWTPPFGYYDRPEVMARLLPRRAT